MPQRILVADARGVRLEGSPISPAWILAGTPQARAMMASKSRDRNATVVVWECTTGEFVWHYSVDETVIVLSGEAFVTNERGEECRLAEGHVAVFPGGSSSRWRITAPIRKVAVLRPDMPRLVAFGVLAWHRLLRICGWRGGAAVIPTAIDRPFPRVVRQAVPSPGDAAPLAAMRDAAKTRTSSAVGHNPGARVSTAGRRPG
jgi:uncharacterized protein